MRFLVRFLCVVCVMSMCGCTMLRPIKTIPSSSYTLTTWPKNTAATPQQPTSKATLLVTEPLASPGYQSSRMVYVMVPYELQAYANHRWVAPPSSLLLPLIADRLRGAGYFQAVVTSPFSGLSTYQLNTELLLLQQEFLRPDSVIRMRIEATLICTATGQVLGNRVFEAVVPANGNDPYSGVLATNKATKQLLNQIAAFVVKRAR